MEDGFRTSIAARKDRLCKLVSGFAVAQLGVSAALATTTCVNLVWAALRRCVMARGPVGDASMRKRSKERDGCVRQHVGSCGSVVPGKRRRSAAAASTEEPKLTVGEPKLTVEEQEVTVEEQEVTVEEQTTTGGEDVTVKEQEMTVGEHKSGGCVLTQAVGEQVLTVGEQKDRLVQEHVCLPDGAPEHELFLVSIKTMQELEESVDVVAEAKEVDVVLQQRLQQQQMTTDDVDVAWGHEFAALDSLRRFAKCHHDQARRQLDNGVLVKFVLPAASNLRSIMARNALLCVQELILGLKAEMTAYYNVVVPVLLNRACSKKQFLRDLARDVLDTALRAGADEEFLNPLLSTATTEKNAQIVGVAGVYMSKCIVRMDHAHLQTYVLETRSSFFDEMASFLNCKAVECKTATRRSCQHTRRVIGNEAFIALAKEKLKGTALSDMLRASETRKSAEPGQTKMSIRERVLQLKKQQQQQQQRQRSEGNDALVTVATSPPL